MSLASMMESKANIYRLGISQDDYGGTLQSVIQSTTPRAKNVPTSYQEGGASPKLVYGQRNTITSSTLYFMANPNVEVNDVVVATNVRTGEVIYCNVEGQAEAVGRGRCWTVSVQRIRQPV